MKRTPKLVSSALILAALLSAFPVTGNATETHSSEGLPETGNPIGAVSKEETKQEKMNNIVLGKNDLLKNCPTSEKVLSALTGNDTFSVNGLIVTDLGEYDINEYYDFSQMSRYEIADWACNSGLISEKEKIECYCDLILKKNFENEVCLTGIVSEIQDYREKFAIPLKMNQKISEILMEKQPGDVELMSTSTPMSSTNFIVYYDNNYTNSTEAKKVLDYLEELRTTYLNWGFQAPIKTDKHRVYLDPTSDPNATSSAVTLDQKPNGNVCESFIEVYNFNTLTETIKDLLAHEYFHLVQNAYNRQNGWFKEACATMANFLVNKNASIYSDQIIKFIHNFGKTNFLETDVNAGQGAVFFPMTIYKDFGGIGTIRAIYEEYHKYSASVTSSTLCTIIDNGIHSIGYSDGFNMAFRRVGAYMVNPSSTSFGLYNLMKLDETVRDTDNYIKRYDQGIIQPGIRFEESVNYMYTKYYEIELHQNPQGDYSFKMLCSNPGDYVAIVKVNKNGGCGVKYINYEGTSSIITGEYKSIRSTTDHMVLVVSGTNGTKLDISDNFAPLYEISSTSRYFEENLYTSNTLLTNVEGICSFKFTTGGSKIFQTFGATNATLELYDSNDRLLKSDKGNGYNSYNSFIRYEVKSGTTYKLKIKFQYPTAENHAKLVVTPTQWLISNSSPTGTIERFKDIWTVTGSTSYSIGTGTALGNVKAMVFNPSVSGNYTVETTGSTNTYIYVLDPSTYQLMNSSNYDDNSGKGYNASLLFYMSAGVPYIIFYSAADISNSAQVGSTTLKITKK